MKPKKTFIIATKDIINPLTGEIIVLKNYCSPIYFNFDGEYCLENVTAEIAEYCATGNPVVFQPDGYVMFNLDSTDSQSKIENVTSDCTISIL